MKTLSNNLIILLSFLLIFNSFTVAYGAEPAGYAYLTGDGYQNGSYQIKYGVTNWSWLYNHTYIGDGTNWTLDTNHTILHKNGNNNYTINNRTYILKNYGGEINVINTTFKFNITRQNDCGFRYNNWTIYNSTLLFDSSRNPNGYFLVQIDPSYGPLLYDFTKNYIEHSAGVYMYNMYLSDIEIHNNSFFNSRDGIWIYDAQNKYIRDLYFYNMSRVSFLCYNCSDIRINNVSINSGDTYLDPKTYIGFVVDGSSHNITATNIYVNGSPWSGVEATGSSYNGIYENITVNHAGHNGIDLHGQWNFTVKNATVNGSISNNFLLAGQDDRYTPNGSCAVWDESQNPCSHDITVIDYRSYNVTAEGTTGQGLYANRIVNFTAINITSDNEGGGVQLNYMKNATVLNVTIKNNWQPEDFYLGDGTDRGSCIDCSIIDAYYDGKMELISTKNTRILNTNGTIGFYNAPNYPAEYIMYYYIDVAVKDSANSPIEGTSVKLTTDNSSAQNINGWARYKTIFYTTSSGHTPLPNQDRTNSPAIADYYRNSSGVYHQFSHTATITTPTGATVTLSGITPDSSWYRSNPNIPTYTITAIVPTGSTGPHITGFAPSEDNPFNTGESKIFRIWTDESLNSMEWYLDGTLVSQDSLTYTWSVTDGNHTIEFKGSNTNGTVTHRWDINGGFGLDLPPTASAGPDITTYPGDIITFDGSGSTDDNGIISYVWDFDSSDGLQEDAIGQVVSHTYSTPGIYTVTLTVSDTNGSTDSDTAIITVNEPATSINKDPVPPEYWNYYNGAGSGDWGRTTDEAHSGSYSAFLQGTGYSSNYLNIGLVVGDSNGYSGLNAYNATPGKTYNVSFWIKGDFNYVDVVAMTWNTEDGSSGRNWIPTSIGTINPDNIWTKYQGTFTTPSDAKKLVLIFKVMGDSSQINLGTIYVDDVEINGSGNIILNPGAENTYTNNAPVLNPIGPKSISEGSPLQFTITASDPDSDPLTYSATNLPGGATFDPDTRTFSWTPADGQAGLYTVRFEVTDGALTDSEDVMITVYEAEVEVTVPLYKGWNLISLPVINNTFTASTLANAIGGVTHVMKRSTTTDDYVDYIVGFSGPGDDFVISPDEGYYVYMENEKNFTFKGTQPGTRTIDLVEGWNLIGWTSLNSSDAVSAFVNPLSSTIKYAAKRNSPYGGYEKYVAGFSDPADNFNVEAGYGYFVYLTSNSTLIHS